MANQYRRLPPQGGDPRLTAEVVNNLLEGKLNSTGTVTLATGGATTTTLYDRRIGADSVILFVPSSLSAAATNYYPYGTFEHDATQTFAAADTPYVLNLSDAEFTYGMSLASNQITVDYAGLYDVDITASFSSTNSQIVQAYIWLRVNGTDVDHSLVRFGVPDKQGYTTGVQSVHMNHPLDLSADDYVEIVAAVDDAVVQLSAVAVQTTPYARPSMPSLMVNLEMMEPSQTAGTAFEMYVTDRQKGQATINHLPNSVSGKTYDYVIIG